MNDCKDLYCRYNPEALSHDSGNENNIIFCDDCGIYKCPLHHKKCNRKKVKRYYSIDINIFDVKWYVKLQYKNQLELLIILELFRRMVVKREHGRVENLNFTYELGSNNYCREINYPKRTCIWKKNKWIIIYRRYTMENMKLIKKYLTESNYFPIVIVELILNVI